MTHLIIYVSSYNLKKKRQCICGCKIDRIKQYQTTCLTLVQLLDNWRLIHKSNSLLVVFVLTTLSKLICTSSSSSGSSSSSSKYTFLHSFSVVGNLKQKKSKKVISLSHFRETLSWKVHCMKSVRVRSYSSSYFPAFGLNTDQNNSEYEHFFRRGI